MPFSPEMDPFDTEIRSDKYIKLPTNPLDGTIISNAGDQRPASSGLVSHARNESFFGERHPIIITSLASRGERRQLKKAKGITRRSNRRLQGRNASQGPSGITGPW
jgi:hypothetical protein